MTHILFFRFSLEIETYYTPDGGHQDNVFKLSDSEKRNRVVDLIDVVKDQVRIYLWVKLKNMNCFEVDFCYSVAMKSVGITSRHSDCSFKTGFGFVPRYLQR